MVGFDYYEVFRDEAVEQLAALEACLLNLERDPDAVQEAFRLYHTLKGNAAVVGCRSCPLLPMPRRTFWTTSAAGSAG
jgi:chemotaxis protein histidine kinase CheA